MRKIVALVIALFSLTAIYSQNLQTDTFTYTVNLDLSTNLFLKTLPVDLLKGYCQGKWNAYYPQYEMNQCLFDDFLEHYSYKQNTISNDHFCWDDYCSQFENVYDQFQRKLKYKEIVSFDKQHSIVKREVLWIQVFYSRNEYDGWRHYPGLIFWMKELRQGVPVIQIYNKDRRFAPWDLDKTFNNKEFIINENPLKDDKKKVNKYNDVEEQ